MYDGIGKRRGKGRRDWMLYDVLKYVLIVCDW